jgi:outer membrane protein
MMKILILESPRELSMYSKHWYISCLLILFIFFVCKLSYAQESDKQIKLSLQDCINLALKSNLSIQVQRIDPKIQDTFVMMAEGNFDPSISFGPTISKSKDLAFSASPTGTDVRTSDNQELTLGITDPVITGGSYGISFSSNRSNSNSIQQTLNPSYRSGLTFSITQPLLRDFGISVNKSSITIAKNNKDISILQLKSQLIDTLSNVQNYYWELVFAIENLKVQQLALKQAQDLLIINQKFKENGKATISDILQAEAAVASREADVISATDAIKDTEENLKRITNIIQDETLWNVTIQPTDTPSFEEVKADLVESIATALKERPEYNQAKIDISNSDISIMVAKNQTLPIMDLQGSLTLNGLGGNFGDPISQVGKADYRAWNANIALRMPIGNRVSKAGLKRSELIKEQKLLDLKDLEQQIISDVRRGVRILESDRKRIDATTAAEDFARQVLATEDKKYNLGLSTSYQLLQFQASLTTATQNKYRAIIDYRKSIVNLYQSNGVTLDKLNIKFEN